ncbi:Na(+)-translocating NADH-quinone reductase subunit D [Loktanella sp. 5RATIMAR09]|uniref:NADH:ubiquinone reductase (Na(+)-transporting) subunit D n=1 Tax=Loktanella sp. 5RATIMAR09 TaxID=1225655 RepID=UPI0006EB43A7|nr:NADH:ubiquinone reductase (Na(+)-transporting) subunit D [Loktanella sp. 5RATIMAR09]KQI70706.1 Na(+)-translocating NADH-quinone reductase subunit D [Loktanella sp. 5RATIMAR09]
MSTRRLLTDPLVDQNPVTLHLLGICSALAVTTNLDTALTMAAAMTVVLVLASVIISTIRRLIPQEIRLIVQITIIATLVMVIDLALQAFLFDISQRLSIFVSLIVTNCIILGRAEAFAMRNPPWPSLVDALGNAAGYSLVLVVVAILREILGTGDLLGYSVLPTVENGGWFEPLGFMALAPSAFIVLGLLVWALRALRPSQIEAPDYAARGTEGRP